MLAVEVQSSIEHPLRILQAYNIGVNLPLHVRINCGLHRQTDRLTASFSGQPK